MVFSELRFLGFYLIVFLVHWALRSPRARKIWLLLASYVFYGAWDWRFLILLFASSVLDYGVGQGLARVETPRSRKLFLAASVVGNLGLLGVFKYYDFFVENGVALLRWLGIPASASVLGLILPAGISFYTFQTLSYSIDVYRRHIPTTKSFLDLMLFVSFFPQLVAGPIVRAADFIPQLATERRFARVDVRACLILFLIGFFKKAVVSDGIAELVDPYFADPSAFDAASAWSAVLFYLIQLYCDFSAYSDMALATAGLLGFNLCLNFDFPYFATSITDFWRRWHISLSTWLTDYLYLPLGGSRGGTLLTWRNLAITWILAGLWHGADWRFVIFGAMMAVGLIVHREWSRGWGRTIRIPPVVGCAMTVYFICIAQIFFRSQDLARAGETMRAFVTFASPGRSVLGDRLPWVWLLLAAIHWISYRKYVAEWWRRLPAWAFACFCALVAAIVLACIHPNAEPFIYFQF